MDKNRNIFKSSNTTEKQWAMEYIENNAALDSAAKDAIYTGSIVVENEEIFSNSKPVDATQSQNSEEVSEKKDSETCDINHIIVDKTYFGRVAQDSILSGSCCPPIKLQSSSNKLVDGRHTNQALKTHRKRGAGMVKKLVTIDESYCRIFSEPGDYSEWLKTASRRQKSLLKKICSMEIELFGDLLFEEPLEEDLLDPDNAPLIILDDCLPLDGIRISFEPNFEVEGIYWQRLHHIVMKSAKPFDAVIHEVLHVYEVYFECRKPLHDFWTIRLYSRLLLKIPILDKICIGFVNVWLGFGSEMGDTHSMLFLLKSLDIDLRLDIPLGTTFGYGLAEYISQLNKREDVA